MDTKTSTTDLDNFSLPFDLRYLGKDNFLIENTTLNDGSRLLIFGTLQIVISIDKYWKYTFNIMNFIYEVITSYMDEDSLFGSQILTAKQCLEMHSHYSVLL